MLTSIFCHLNCRDRSRLWEWFNATISSVSNLIDVSPQSLAGDLITKVSGKFSLMNPTLPIPKEILQINCLLFCPWGKISYFSFSRSTLKWIAHSDLKILFMTENHIYLANYQLCSQLAKVISFRRLKKVANAIFTKYHF